MVTIGDMEEGTKEKILSLFKDNSDLDSINRITDIDIGRIPIGMTQFQIENFVLNRKEFSTPLMQYSQAKMELYSRINIFVDDWYQLREAKAKIMLAEGRIEELNANKELNSKIREAKIELQQIEIDKNQFKLGNIEKQAKDKLREAIVFHNTFNKYRYLEDLPKEELDKMEEEGWRIKSAYYHELVDRYGLTPRGQIEYPHEIEGLSGLLKALDNNNGQIRLHLKNNEDIKQL